MPTEAKRPSEWSAEDRACFECLVLDGGEVSPDALSERIDSAEALVCHREEGGYITGVAAIKNPARSYKQRVFQKAGEEEEQANYYFELGWVYVRPAFRGSGLSRSLVETALAMGGVEGVFATTRADNM